MNRMQYFKLLTYILSYQSFFQNFKYFSTSVNQSLYNQTSDINIEKSLNGFFEKERNYTQLHKSLRCSESKSASEKPFIHQPVKSSNKKNPWHPWYILAVIFSVTTITPAILFGCMMYINQICSRLFCRQNPTRQTNQFFIECSRTVPSYGSIELRKIN